MSAPPSTAASSRRQSAASSPLADEEDGFAAALALQEAAARPGLAKKEVARLLEKVRKKERGGCECRNRKGIQTEKHRIDRVL